MDSGDGYITPPPGLLPPAPQPDGVPERERIEAVPGGMPVFAPSPVHAPGPTIPAAPVPPSDAQLGPQSDATPDPGWALRLGDGTRLPLDGAAFVGRNPAVTAAAPRASVLPLDDPARSLSKTHALLVPQLDWLMVTDLHSTNGVAAVAPDGAVTMLEPGRSSPVAPGSTLRLGSFEVVVEHG